MFWNKKWHHQDEAILSNGTNDTRQWEHCEEASLAECWDFITIAMANNTEGDKIVLETKCGTWNIATQTMALNCKLRLNWAYFACSLACWLLPPVAFGSLLTYLKYKVSPCPISRTALLLRTDMSILRAEHMRPFFPEVTAASPEAQFLTTGRQMKDMDIIFPLIPSELL